MGAEFSIWGNMGFLNGIKASETSYAESLYNDLTEYMDSTNFTEIESDSSIEKWWNSYVADNLIYVSDQIEDLNRYESDLFINLCFDILKELLADDYNLTLDLYIDALKKVTFEPLINKHKSVFIPYMKLYKYTKEILLKQVKCFIKINLYFKNIL